MKEIFSLRMLILYANEILGTINVYILYVSMSGVFVMLQAALLNGSKKYS